MQTTAHPRFHPRLLPQGLGRREAIEWEELPSFADSLTQRLVQLGARPGSEHFESASPAWIETVSAELDFSPPSEPFREPLQGLQTREVYEPEIFRTFFGN